MHNGHARVFSIEADARPSAVNNNYDGRFVLHRLALSLSFSHATLSQRRYRVLRGHFAASARPPLTKLQRRANGSRGAQSVLFPSLFASLFLFRIPVRVFNPLSGLRFPPSRDQYSATLRKRALRPPARALSLSLFPLVSCHCFPTSRRIPRLYGYILPHTDL